MPARSHLNQGATHNPKRVAKKLELIENTLDALDGNGATSAMKLYAFAGRNGAGAVTLTGAAVGDKVVGVANSTDGANGASSFEATITVANQIQQSSASDLTTKRYTVLLVTPQAIA